MSLRAQRLATKFEETNREFIELVNSLSPEDWHRICEDEGWTVGVTAHHVAVNHAALRGVILAIVDGSAPAITWEMLDGINANHAREHGDCSKEETLEILSRDGAAARDTVAALSDDELAKTADMPFMSESPVTTAQFIDNGLIGHIGLHEPSIRRATQSMSVEAGASRQR